MEHFTQLMNKWEVTWYRSTKIKNTRSRHISYDQSIIESTDLYFLINSLLVLLIYRVSFVFFIFVGVAHWFDIGLANQGHGFKSRLAHGCLSLGEGLK